jgi:hypothetical protein
MRMPTLNPQALLRRGEKVEKLVDTLVKRVDNLEARLKKQTDELWAELRKVEKNAKG